MSGYRPIEPNMRPQDYTTYQILCPRSSHFAVVSCEDAECPHYRDGWRSVFDENTDLGKRQAHYVRHESGRGFKEYRTPEGLTGFLFSPGQPCFTQHKMRNDRLPLFRVKGGDYRGNPLGVPTVTHKRADDWVEDFAEHQDKVKTILERG